MRIITVSRQFGSGGRELGKRLADILQWDYYDKEIIETLADEHGLDQDYVKDVLNNHGWNRVQLTYRNSFSHLMMHPGIHTQLLQRQAEIIRQIAGAGHDCIIIGRDADVILQEYHPFRIYICADMEARLGRCLGHEQRRSAAEQLSEKEIRRNIRRIDRSRIRTREVLTGRARGDGSMFDLTLNVTGRDIRRTAEALADFSQRWFEDAL